MYIYKLLWPKWSTPIKEPNSLTESISLGWSVVESAQDMLNEKVALENNVARKRELDQMIQRNEKKISSKNFREEFAVLIMKRNEKDRNLLTQSIDTPEANSILKKIIKENSDSWLNILSSCYLRRSGVPQASWNSLVSDWHEQQFAKGIEGRLRDTALMRYGNSLTPQILTSILQSICSGIQGTMRENLKVDLSNDEIEELETALVTAVAQIIDLHIQVVRTVSTAKANEGNLPKLWDEKAKNTPCKVPDARFVKLDKTIVGDSEKISREEMELVRNKLSMLIVPRPSNKV